ncbi:hypothetical protein M2163_000352 [Streptomyces sp. SAI-135]|nr:hypothetical protein [Streptomyces sp. SAI-090]MDH6574027.1 hypothetical protein [Streptomyces sp. SAI-117]MDH6613244.1 hypothetical protein [Streptomyces sp. SAI-135]
MPRHNGTTCARAHGLVDALNRLGVTLSIPTLTDLGYENAADGLRHPLKKPKAVNSPSPTRSSTL